MARESKSTYGSIEAARPAALETDRLLQDSLSVLHNTHEISKQTELSLCVGQQLLLPRCWVANVLLLLWFVVVVFAWTGAGDNVMLSMQEQRTTVEGARRKVRGS